MLLAHKTVSTDVFDRSGTTFLPGETLPGLSSARLLRLRSVGDSGGGFSAAAIFDLSGGLYYRHLTPGSITWPLPNVLTASYTSVSLAFAPDGSMVAAYGMKDGAVTGVRRDKTGKPQGSLQLAPPSSATGELAVAATAGEVSLLYSSTAWFVRTASGSERLPNAKVGLGTPDLALGPDGALRAVVYEPAGAVGVVAHLLDRRGGSWHKRTSVSGAPGRAYATPSGGTAMLVMHHLGPGADELLLVECE